MNKIVPENPIKKETPIPILQTDEDEIQVPKLQVDPEENNPNLTMSNIGISKKKSHSHSKNNSYVDLTNLEAEKQESPLEKSEHNTEEIELVSCKDKLEKSMKTYEEKESITNDLDSFGNIININPNQNNNRNSINANNLNLQATTTDGLTNSGASITKKRTVDKKRTLRIDSQSFLKKPLTAGIQAQIPIDKLSLMIDKDNERYISQTFDFKFGSDKNWLNIMIPNDLLSTQETIDIRIFNSNDELPYKWELKDLYRHEEGSCFFGKVFEAVDLNSNKKYTLKIVDYEVLDLVVLHDFIYNVLICRYLTMTGGFESVLKVFDLYITENENIFEGIKHHTLVIVMENAPMTLGHLINIRRQKQLKWKDEELLVYLYQFAEELQSIYVSTGWCCELDPLNIFYSGSTNSLKISNFRKRATTMHLQSEEVNWSIQIKTLYNTISAMKSLSFAGSTSPKKVVKRMESDSNLKEEALNAKNQVSGCFFELLNSKPEEFKEVDKKIKSVCSLENLKKSDEHLVFEIYYVHEKKDNTENMIKNFSFFSKKYESLLQFTQAFECYEKVIKYRQNDLQMNEKSFLKIKYYMGYIFFQTGYFEEAMVKLKEVNEELANKFPDEFTLSVDIEIIFGMIEKQKKEIDNSIRHFEAALQILRKNGQLSNLKTSQILIYLGYLYDVFGLNLSQIKKAHRYYSEALNIRKLILKNKYQNNLVHLINNLGIVSHKLEKYDQSIEFFEEVLAIEEKSQNKARMANAKMNLGVIYQEQQNYDEALKFFEEALELHKTLGFLEENKDVLNIYNNMATIYQIQGKYGEAIKFYKDALRIKESEAKPEEKVNIEILLNNLASIYYRAGFYEKSKQFYQKSLSMKRASYGVENPSIAFTLNNLGLVFEKLNQEQEALKYYEESLTIKRKFFSDKHMSIGQTLTNLMYLCSKLGYTTSALDYGKQALEIKRTNSGKDYQNLSGIASFLANLYELDKKYQEAIAMYNEALIYQRMVNDGSNEVAILMQKVAELSEILNENEKAIKIFDDCLNIYKTNLGLINRQVGEVMCKIADTYHKLKMDDVAKAYYEGAVKVLGKLEEIDEELIQNIEDQIKKLKHFKNNKVSANNNKVLKLMEEIYALTEGKMCALDP